MCGIVGVVGRAWEPGLLERMVAAQRHRGPDDEGLLTLEVVGYGSDPALRVGLGHNRLSILDLSPAGRQPMCDPSGTRWVVFNGEIYNFLELRAELGGNAAFRTGTDTEVLLAAYERWGDHCVDHFIGMFSFALWDGVANRLFCARDRLGIKPFHYGWSDGAFLFASEVATLLAGGHPSEPDADRWATYLVHGVYDHDEGTFVRGIRSLPPGHTLVLEGEGLRAPAARRVRTSSYWDVFERSSELWSGSEEEAAQLFHELLRDSVRLRLRADVAVGVNLSGGLDSASLMVSVDEAVGAGAEVETFTAAFADPRYDESPFADRVPHVAKWGRNVRRIDAAGAWATLHDALAHQSAPIGGIATLAYHDLHGLARERGVTVLLEGQGVDELLAGYVHHRAHHYRDLLDEGRESEVVPLARSFGETPEQALAAARSIGLRAGTAIYQDGTHHLRTACLTPEIVERAGPAPEFPSPFGDHLRNALYHDLRYVKLPRVLRMNDRLSMAWGRELREPFLDHRLVELAFRLPGRWKIRDGSSKAFLRGLTQGMLPDEVRLHPKRAVVTPQREWLRGELASSVRSALGSHALREQGWVAPGPALAEFDRFVGGAGENSFFVWQWLMAHWVATRGPAAPPSAGARAPS